MKPFVFALTGGPGAGKTDALKLVSKELSDAGYRVYVAAEVATMLILGGNRPQEMTHAEHYAFQVAQVGIQVALEAGYSAQARLQARPAVILCDRGVMDGASYYGLSGWPAVLAANGLGLESASVSRYDAVIHLESTANGCPENYPGNKNPARWQDVAGSAKSDLLLRDVWGHHPRYAFVPCQPSFEEKVARIVFIIKTACAA